MRLLLISPAFVLLAACGSGGEAGKIMLKATGQMDGAAAAAGRNAVAAGTGRDTPANGN